jgi:CRP-like cAMP-binding protein
MNDHASLLANVAKHITLEKEESSFFLSLLQPKTLKRKEYLLTKGEPCTTISYVISGAMRAFYVSKEEKESTIMFAVADWWITDMGCFVNQSRTDIFIEAIEESTVWQLSKTQLDTLYNRVPKFERYFRILMQNSYIREQQRVLQNLSLTAEERYQLFLKKYPTIVQHVTQKQIASYLGITPEFLSAIRKNYSKGIIS